jgi:hypothetical protein
MHAVHASTVLKNNLSSPHTSMICSMSDFQKRKKVLSGQILGAANECMFAENFNADKELQTRA